MRFLKILLNIKKQLNIIGMKSFFILLGVVFMLPSIGYSQEIGNNNIANNYGTVQLSEKKVDVLQTQNRGLFDVEFWFDTPVIRQSGIATDGVNFYTSSSTGTSFYRYNMNGSNPELFTITGVPKITNMTYDGEYFYGVNWDQNIIYKMDLANQTLVSAIAVIYPDFYYGPQCITYDPNLDDGNGGFWVSDFYMFGAVSMAGIQLMPAINMGWQSLAGLAYDPYTDPLNPCLWIFTGGGGGSAVIKQYDINTMSFTEVSHNSHVNNPYSAAYSDAQGLFAYNNGEGKFLLAATILSPGYYYVLVYELCVLALPAAPGPVTDLTVTPDALGELVAELAWTNPILTEEGGILTQLTSIRIYENEELIHSISNPIIGGEETYTATVTEAGEYIYNVVAVNSFGESMPSIIVEWVGHDVPSAPENVIIVKNGAVAELSWDEVTTGLHERYFTVTGLTYDVIRFPEEVTVASNITTSTFSESIVPLQGYYFYRVVAKNDFGVGGYTDSNIGVFCDVKTVPYFEGFENNGTNFPSCWEQEFVELNSRWEVVHQNNAVPTIDGVYMAEIRPRLPGSEITKLITPPLVLSGDGNYVLSFWSAPRAHVAPLGIIRTYYKTSPDSEWNLLDEYTPQYYSYNHIQNWRKRTLALPEGTDYYFVAFEAEVNSYGVWLDAISVIDARIVTGTISTIVEDGEEPVVGAKVEFVGTDFFAFTDEMGNYTIWDIEVGEYEVKVNGLGYYEVNVPLTVEEHVTVKDFILTPLPIFSVNGKVTGSDSPDGLAGVTVTLSGYNTYTTTTDEFGDYLFEEVFGDKIYDISASKIGYLRYFSTTSLIDDDVSYDISLNESANPVINPVATDNISNVGILWGQPLFGTADNFRYDSGIANGSLGFYGNEAPRGVIGSCYRVNATLESIQWFLTDHVVPTADYVNVYIFSLNNEGSPSKNILFSQTMVPTTVMEWNEFVFPTPVQAPNGFYVALSRPVGMFLGIGSTEPNEEWPYQSNTHYSCSDYAVFDFMVVSPLTNYVNLMIRAEGYTLGKAAHFGYPVVTSVKLIEEIDINPVFIPSEPFKTEESSIINGGKSLQNYKVYRLFDGQQNDDTKWTMLDGNVNGLSYTDNAWGTMGEGVYLWGVKAEYTSNNISVPRLTNKLVKGMQYTFTVNLNTNSDDPATGAIVKLTNQDGNPEHIFTKTATGNVVTIDLVWKGTYDISITEKFLSLYGN